MDHFSYKGVQFKIFIFTSWSWRKYNNSSLYTLCAQWPGFFENNIYYVSCVCASIYLKNIAILLWAVCLCHSKCHACIQFVRRASCRTRREPFCCLRRPAGADSISPRAKNNHANSLLPGELFCHTLHIMDSHGGSVIVHKKCAGPEECSPATVGCLDIDSQRVRHVIKLFPNSRYIWGGRHAADGIRIIESIAAGDTHQRRALIVCAADLI